MHIPEAPSVSAKVASDMLLNDSRPQYSEYFRSTLPVEPDIWSVALPPILSKHVHSRHFTNTSSVRNLWVQVLSSKQVVDPFLKARSPA